MRLLPAETISATEARQNFAQLINRVYHERSQVLVEKSGIPVVALISIDELDRFNRLDEQRARSFAVLDSIRAAFKDVPPEELEREAQRALDDVRAELRAERNQAAEDGQ